MFHDRPFHYRRKVQKLLENQKKANEVLFNINYVMDQFKRMYQEKEVTVQERFGGALSDELRRYGKEVYSASPPKYLYRYMSELKWVYKTINEDKLMYRRPKCFDDKKEVDLHRLIRENHERFSEDSVDAFSKLT